MAVHLQLQTVPRWAKDRTYCIGNDAEAQPWTLLSEVRVLDKQKYTSVEDAVTALNSGRLAFSEFCIVFSARRQAHYLLWPADKTTTDVADLIGVIALVKNGMANSRISNKSTMKVSNATVKMSNALLAYTKAPSRYDRDALLSTTDSTPEHPTVTTSDIPFIGGVQVKASEYDGTLENVVRSSWNRATASSQGYQQEASSNPVRSAPRTLQARMPVLISSGDNALMPPRIAATSSGPSNSLLASHQSALTTTQTPASSSMQASTRAAPTLLGKGVVTPPHPSAECTSGGSPTTDRLPALKKMAFADIEEMVVEPWKLDGEFDPCDPQTRWKLLEKLGFGADTTIEPSMDNSGMFNQGVWNVSTPSCHGLVLKLVQSSRRHPECATDTEKFVELARICPHIVKEYSVSFPVKIFQVLEGPNGDRGKDLIVMRAAGGLQLTQIIYHKYHANELGEVLRIFKEFGKFMFTIHRVYKGMQHGDCQPSNVFYGNYSGGFTLIDVADMGYGPFVAEGGEDDVEHFIWGVRQLAQWYGEQFIADCERHFRAGYSEGKQRKVSG